MWKTLLGLREKVKEHIGYKIGNAKKISMWHDIWHQYGQLSQYITQRDIYNARLSSSNSIADVTDNGVWKWPNEWFSKYPILNNIKAPCLDINLEDKIVWVTNSGSQIDFSVGNTWKDLYAKGQIVEWKSLVWFAQCIPSHSFVLWMAIHERLKTQDKVMKWKPNEVLKCVLCGKCSDSHEHLFFECEYSTQIWEAMQDLMNRKTAKKWKDIVEEFSKIPACNNIRNIVCKLICGAAVCFIWQERNARIFRKTKRDEAAIIQLITDTVKMKMMSFRVKDSIAVRAVEEK